MYVGLAIDLPKPSAGYEWIPVPGRPGRWEHVMTPAGQRARLDGERARWNRDIGMRRIMECNQ